MRSFKKKWYRFKIGILMLVSLAILGVFVWFFLVVIPYPGLSIKAIFFALLPVVVLNRMGRRLFKRPNYSKHENPPNNRQVVGSKSI